MRLTKEGKFILMCLTFLMPSSSAEEQLTVNQLVVGSIPTWAATLKPADFAGFFCACVLALTGRILGLALMRSMNSQDFKIIVLCGAQSPEREVSVRSGTACAEALRSTFPETELRVLEENALPEDLNPQRDIIFPVIHGDYGEDGKIQRELESRGFSYAGCDTASSEICIDKSITKKIMREHGIPATDDITFRVSARPDVSAVIAHLGEALVVKPADKGSSVGLFLPTGSAELQTVLEGNLSAAEKWIIEPRLSGRELTVGLLGGKAMGIVEIRPKTGVYDFTNKYTSGNTEYLFPAPIEESIAARIKAQAEKLFTVCGCRDFSRADVILCPDGSFYFLEVNTIPGLTATSLLPKSASCVGLDFPALTAAMIRPAIERFKNREGNL